MIDYYAWKTVPADTQGDPQPADDAFANSNALMHRFLGYCFYGPSGPGKVIHPHVVAVENIPVA